MKPINTSNDKTYLSTVTNNIEKEKVNKNEYHILIFIPKLTNQILVGFQILKPFRAVALFRGKY